MFKHRNVIKVVVPAVVVLVALVLVLVKVANAGNVNTLYAVSSVSMKACVGRIEAVNVPITAKTKAVSIPEAVLRKIYSRFGRDIHILTSHATKSGLYVTFILAKDSSIYAIVWDKTGRILAIAKTHLVKVRDYSKQNVRRLDRGEIVYTCRATIYKIELPTNLKVRK